MKNRPRILPYCMASIARTAHQATGAWPVTCPPFDARSFPVGIFTQFDLIWLGLHGTEENPRFLYGDSALMAGLDIPVRKQALDVRSLRGLDLLGKIVFATTCHLPKTDFPAAFKACGATVIGGPGQNYGDTMRLVGADRLGAALVAALRNAVPIEKALDEAKRVLDLRVEADRDAAEFGII